MRSLFSFLSQNSLVQLRDVRSLILLSLKIRSCGFDTCILCSKTLARLKSLCNEALKTPYRSREVFIRSSGNVNYPPNTPKTYQKPDIIVHRSRNPVENSSKTMTKINLASFLIATVSFTASSGRRIC